MTNSANDNKHNGTPQYRPIREKLCHNEHRRHRIKKPKRKNTWTSIDSKYYWDKNREICTAILHVNNIIIIIGLRKISLE